MSHLDHGAVMCLAGTHHDILDTTVHLCLPAPISPVVLHIVAQSDTGDRSVNAKRYGTWKRCVVRLRAGRVGGKKYTRCSSTRVTQLLMKVLSTGEGCEEKHTIAMDSAPGRSMQRSRVHVQPSAEARLRGTLYTQSRPHLVDHPVRSASYLPSVCLIENRPARPLHSSTFDMQVPLAVGRAYLSRLLHRTKYRMRTRDRSHRFVSFRWESPRCCGP